MSVSDSKLCFIDTNIWLYAFVHVREQSKTATAKITIQSNQVLISTQVINEVCVNLIKKAAFDEVNIQQLIQSFYNKYHVADIDQKTMLTASKLRARYKFSYWDSLIVACALTEKATVVFSEDMHSGLVVENYLQIINPFT